jgi:hypothetical protein
MLPYELTPATLCFIGLSVSPTAVAIPGHPVLAFSLLIGPF